MPSTCHPLPLKLQLLAAIHDPRPRQSALLSAYAIVLLNIKLPESFFVKRKVKL
jgi:hypothetical protein